MPARRGTPEHRWQAMLPHLRNAAAGRGYLLACAIPPKFGVVAIPKNEDAITWTQDDVAEAVRIAAKAEPTSPKVQELYGQVRYFFRVATTHDIDFDLLVLHRWEGVTA